VLATSSTAQRQHVYRAAGVHLRYHRSEEGEKVTAALRVGLFRVGGGTPTFFGGLQPSPLDRVQGSTSYACCSCSVDPLEVKALTSIPTPLHAPCASCVLYVFTVGRLRPLQTSEQGLLVMTVHRRSSRFASVAAIFEPYIGVSTQGNRPGWELNAPAGPRSGRASQLDDRAGVGAGADELHDVHHRQLGEFERLCDLEVGVDLDPTKCPLEKNR
jgi:hypothetical protein